MSPAKLVNGVQTRLNYRKPPATPESLNTAISLYSQDDAFHDQREVLVKDVRHELDRFTIESEGFEYLHDVVDIQDWDDAAEVKRVLLKETPELIRKRLGASQVYLTAERIRHSVNDGTKTDTTPVYAIHGDATRQSGWDLLQTSLAQMDAAERPTNLPPTGRVMLVNVWRPLRTITRDPLGFLVSSSVKAEDRHEQRFSRPQDTFSVFGRPRGDYWLDTPSWSEDHEWVFLRHQRPEEPVMFAQWDSRGCEQGGGKFENKYCLYHSCFEDEECRNDRGRASMELKCLVFFDED
ncbi:hypothetical protein EJ03DRAFT_323319 [Teratosphaeria nubilosa]|uniref:CmcJ-like methyltransferase n=1 Tax=Teratosphaeria nubilosa TaxID=161662 RepID=A0A6G1LNF6_9PEZI|nr:hypothetical protein EJ03DRAFT_323319 [Teratosphaeria nubilosa]